MSEWLLITRWHRVLTARDGDYRTQCGLRVLSNERHPRPVQRAARDAVSIVPEENPMTDLRARIEALPSAMQSKPMERVINRHAVLALLDAQTPATERDPHSPQWEDCKVCGGDHWTKDHPATPQTPATGLREALERIAAADDKVRRPGGGSLAVRLGTLLTATFEARAALAAAPLAERTEPERVEVRNNDDGTVDEVLLYVGKRCVFHLEQMDTGAWWFALYPEGVEDDHFDIHSSRRVRVTQR